MRPSVEALLVGVEGEVLVGVVGESGCRRSGGIVVRVSERQGEEEKWVRLRRGMEREVDVEVETNGDMS